MGTREEHLFDQVLSGFRILFPEVAQFWRRLSVEEETEELLRTELLSVEQLKRAAQRLAQDHAVDRGKGPNRLLARLSENAHALQRYHDVILAADAKGRRLSETEIWLLDNYYLIEQQIELARIHLPRNYSYRLPRLMQEPYQGLPRIYGMAAQLVEHLDGQLDPESVSAFVGAYQTGQVLNLGELWAFPISLRLALIENLRRVAARVASRRRDWEDGMAWAERILDQVEKSPRRLLLLMAQFAEEKRKLSAPFLAELTGRLQGQGGSVAIVLGWIEQVLAEESTNVSQRLHRDSHQQAAEHLSLTNSIGSLRFLGSMDWKSFVEEQSRVEQILLRDPAGAYAQQDFATRDHYRHVVEDLAERSGRSESEVAQMVLEQASAGAGERERSRHVGSYLVGGDRFRFRQLTGCPWSLSYALGLLLRQYRLFFYLSAVLGGSALIALVIPWAAHLSVQSWPFWVMAAAIILPASTLVLSLVNFALTVWVPPRPLPRLDFSEGIPDHCHTMVVIPVLLTGAKGVASLLERLEIHYLANRDDHLQFALLTDFRDAASEVMPEDADLLARARRGIEALNSRYPREGAPAPFHLFHRPRVWNEYEKVWMCWERKRGKLEQFNDLLRGEGREAFSLIVGAEEVLPKIRYVITLDSDTDLPRGAARGMVGALAHPLNRPHYDEALGRITDGYAILQPRVSIRLTSVNQSRYAQLACGESGFDPYSREVSDVYQDLFGEGSFVGKGIYDVDAFRRALKDRFPENLILSHDLIESSYARSGLLGSVEVYEDTPESYLKEVNRQHRWMRGDWQILPWLGRRPPTGNAATVKSRPVSRLGQWKVLDNLRRAMFAPATMALLLAGWVIGPVPPLAWSIFVLLVLGLTGMLRSATQLLRKPRERGLRLHFRTWAQKLFRQCADPLFAISVLPYEAWIALCAFARSALRMPFTRRTLLIWHLRQYARRGARRSPGGFLLEMWVAPCTALLAGALVWKLHPTAWPAMAPFATLWFCSPFISWAISRPLKTKTPNLSSEQWAMLHRLACRTWCFFDTFVGEEDHWLPPDNFQEIPTPQLATRTSPTNMSYGLLTSLSAWDFGFVSTDRLLERLGRMLDTFEKMERYRGHFYNWYDTRTLKPLPPRYISSVDSGNLGAGLLALRAGLLELKRNAALPKQVWKGLGTTLQVLMAEAQQGGSADLISLLREAELMLVAPPAAPAERRDQLLALQKLAARMPEAAGEGATEPIKVWCGFFLKMVRDHARAAEVFAGCAGDELSLHQIVRAESADGTVSDLARKHADNLLRAIDRLAERCNQMQSEMDYEFLYDPHRELLHIGFDVDARRLDPSHYDLLASEARTTSFLMIAEDQAPSDHWFALGRLVVGRGASSALISWSGSMFEYLMPTLLMESYPGTLLTQTCRTVIQRQIRYAHRRQIPWGISESGYNARDAAHAYQYRAFGVPGLGLKRGLSEDLVVAPYATLLALPFEPAAACANITRLISREQALGTYGLYEAIDYTPARVPRDKDRVVIQSYMAHHQGMSLLALSHLLHGAPMVRRFMSDPRVRATAMLLQERVPDVTPTIRPHRREASQVASREEVQTELALRRFTSPYQPVPCVQLLSNGNYHVMVTHVGGSSSRWHDLALTRWREDFTRDNWGVFLYLRDVASNERWSNTYQPLGEESDDVEIVFSPGRAEFRRRAASVDTQTEVCVSPEDDVEIRRITLRNRAHQARLIELTSYAEIVLAPTAADLAHRAFSNLFVQTEILPTGDTILCTRRRRDEREAEVWYFHHLCVMAPTQNVSCETDRAQFLGRGRSPANPIALEQPAGQSAPLSNSADFVLDPIAAVRSVATLDVDTPLRAFLVCGAAATREAALALAEKYRDRNLVDRAFDMAWSHGQIVMRHLNITEEQTQVYDRLAGSVLYANPRNRAPWSVVARNRQGQQGLWRFGVSGDWPIVLLRVADIRQIEFVTDVLRAHAYWKMKGLVSDLVIINEDFSGYRATLNDQIMAAIHASPSAERFDQPGGVFLRRIENLSEEDQILFQSVARVVLVGGTETLREQVERRYVPYRSPPPFEPTATSPDTAPASLAPRPRILENEYGGFTGDGHEYIIMLEPGVTTPAPWSNVVAGERLGFVVTESGGCYTWVDNAHEYRLTTWYNDPVSDPSAESFYLRDEATGRFWSLTPKPAPGKTGYVCRHGFGYTVFEHQEDEWESELWLYAARNAPVRCAVIKLTNHSGYRRSVSLTAYHELVMGEWRHDNLMHIYTEADTPTGMLLAHNPYSRVYPNRVLFASCSETEVVHCGDRTEFIGRNGSLETPAALYRERLSDRTGARYDPAAVLQTFCELAPGETREIVFTLGAADSVEEARQLFRDYGGPIGARSALESVWDYWNRLLGKVYVEIPDQPALNVLVNGWLLYQTLSCRILGRSGYYQSSGAFGYRDQLQDSMALLHAAPEVLRGQILLCASRQFEEGDVQHWWHPPTGAGVRTRITDDRLWLPYATARYVIATGDTGILDEVVPFLTGRPLGEGEESRYDQHAETGESGTLYEHCLRALRVSLRFGAHGLPLMGAGDWNDGMNEVGIAGRGESVWLGWFLYDTLRRFREVARCREDQEVAEWCREEYRALAVRIEESAWDGEWYRRAYFDDGTPLGTAAATEGKIDAISQSWAVLSRAGNKKRARQAMEAVLKHLVRPEDQLVLLLTPPFDKLTPDPGYISRYPPGVRENGAQYSHGAIWTAMAYAELGENDTAWSLFHLLNPIHHSDTPEKTARYKVEPYVMTADIYSAPPHTGRGGWSWYTGAAGWMYRFIVESLLGFQRRPDHLRINPKLPSGGPHGFKLVFHHRTATYNIEVQPAAPAASAGVTVDGQLQEEPRIPLWDDGKNHAVIVTYRATAE